MMAPIDLFFHPCIRSTNEKLGGRTREGCLFFNASVSVPLSMLNDSCFGLFLWRNVLNFFLVSPKGCTIIFRIF